MRIQLSDHFTTGKLLRFVAPSIVMMRWLLPPFTALWTACL
ncbi:MAG: hypothetical protein V8T36_03780 [Ruthenibacterium lactatiformans]